MKVLFELTKLTIELISTCWENVAKMKCTEFESAKFESSKNQVVFQSNQHSGKMAPKSSSLKNCSESIGKIVCKEFNL